MPSQKFSPVVGERVFARVRGHPAWPARVTNVLSKSYRVVFYGTFETSPALKLNALWPYTQENVIKFSKKGISRKTFREGLKQIRDIPEIVPAGYADAGNDENPTDMQLEPEIIDEQQIQVYNGTPVQNQCACQKVKIDMQGVEVQLPRGITIKIGKTSVELPTDKVCALDAVAKKVPEMMADIVGKVAAIHNEN